MQGGGSHKQSLSLMNPMRLNLLINYPQGVFETLSTFHEL